MSRKFKLFCVFLFISAMIPFLLTSANSTAEKSSQKSPAAIPLGKPETTAPKSSIAFRVLDISERTYDNSPAIAVLLSDPLEPRVRHDDHLRISSPKDLLKSAWVLSEDRRILYFPHIEPQIEYSITVLETLKAENGQELGTRVTKTIKTRPITPIVSFASDGLLLPTKMTEGLPVVTVNIRSVEIEFFMLNENALVHFINWQNITNRKDYNYLSQVKKNFGKLMYSGRFDLEAPPNKRTICHIPVENIKELQDPGVYLAVMREPGEYGHNYQSTYFVVTDIGLHARVYKNESLIAASSLKTGSPLPNVKLTFYNDNAKPVGEGVTDEAGTYRFSGKLSQGIFVIKASYANQTGILPMRIPALDLSEFELGKRGYRQREIFLYSPRDLYRPGEKMIVSALLRNDDGEPVQSLPLKAKLFRPDGKETRTFTWHVQNIGSAELNYYQNDVDIPSDAQTGLWKLQVFDDPSSHLPSGMFEFHVEEFLPERMKLELTCAEKYPAPNKKLKIDVLGEYLYGAPAAGNAISARVRVKAKRDLFENFKDFQFGDIKDKDYKDFWEIPDQKLNKDGKGIVTVESKWQELKSPLSGRVTVSLFESGGRPVVRSIEQYILPAQSLVGIRPLFEEKQGMGVEEGPVKFEIIKVKADGTSVPSKNLIVELTKEDRDYYWEYSDASGWQYKYSEMNYQFLTETLILEGGKPTPYTVQLKAGQYILAIKDPETNLTTSIRFHVGSWWWYGGQKSAARPDKVLLKLDKTGYRPGDVVQLTVVPPHEGDALILVEGESLLWSKRMKVSAKGTRVEIPVSGKWDSHNLYISAVVFRPGKSIEKITPNRAIGLVHLPLERSYRQLKVKVDVPAKAASQGPMSIKLKLETGKESQDVNNAEVFVTLAAVDVGILNITEFKTPDPFGWFFEPRRFDVNSYDIYAKVIEILDGKPARLRFGGDSDTAPGGQRPETKVKLLSLFQSPVRFDEKGVAQVTVNLPDFNGRIRIMAVAFSKDSFGSSDTEVTVAAPVVTQLATPRFLAPGDQTEFTLDIHNLSGKEQNLNTTLTADGPVTIENGQKSVPLKDQEKITQRFPVKISDTPPSAFDEKIKGSVIRLHIEGDGINLDSDWQLGVRPGYPAIARKIRNILKGNDNTFTVDPAQVSDMIVPTVEADLKISPFVSLNLRNAMQGLITYPYGCLEQTTSSAFPLIYATPERISQFNLTPITNEERIKRLKYAVDRLASMQVSSGGFGLWSKNDPEVPWLAVYVTDFLLQARDQGVEIPEKMLDHALNRMEAYLQRGTSLENYGSKFETDHLNFSIRSYAAYILAKVGRAPLGSLRTLYKNHTKSGSSLPLAYIGFALKLMGDEKLSKEALKEATQKRCEPFGYWGDYGSLTRDLSMTIALFVDHQAAGIEGFDKLLLDLEDALRTRQWLSTQEKCAIFRAGLSMETLSGKGWKGRLTVAGKETAIDKNGSFVINPTGEDIVKGVTFTADTPEILYASAIINGYTKTPPPKDDSQISIFRELFDSEGKPVDRKEFKVGELLMVHLKISSKIWLPDALVADLLPAGFEVENPNLKHSIKLDDFNIDGKAVWQLKKEMRIIHEEYRDDRYVGVVELNNHSPTHLFYLLRVVSPGTFTVPPPFVESMYRPEIRGIGETTGNIRVINKTNER